MNAGRRGTALVGVVLLVAGCGAATPTPAVTNSPSVSPAASSALGSNLTTLTGTYACDFEGDRNSPSVPFEFRPGGTFVVHSFNPQVEGLTGTWSLQDGSGVLKAAGTEHAFTVEQGNLVFKDFQDPPVWWTQGTYSPSSTVTAFVCFPVSD